MSEPFTADKNWLEVRYEPDSAWDVMPGPHGGTSRVCNLAGSSVRIRLNTSPEEWQEHENCGIGSIVEYLPNGVAKVTIYAP